MYYSISIFIDALQKVLNILDYPKASVKDFELANNRFVYAFIHFWTAMVIKEVYRKKDDSDEAKKLL
jgi:hypothetical protein